MNDTPDILKKILQHKSEQVAGRKKSRPVEGFKEQLEAASTPRGFYRALQGRVNQGQPAIIAEIKKASPSLGVIREDFRPLEIAQSYLFHGATCLSILTDYLFFQGSEANLQMVHGVCPLPILRKDFIIDPYQIYESRALEADCILLIAAALEDPLMGELAELSKELGMDVLIEVHNEEELHRALTLEVPMIGINNRNLHTFETRLQTTLELQAQIPDECLIVTESGIHTREDVTFMRNQGIHSFLVGETFMKATEPGEKLAELFNQV